jgi:hypothetical protein
MIDPINFSYHLRSETKIVYDFLINEDVISLNELVHELSISNNLYVVISSSTGPSAERYRYNLLKNIDPFTGLRVWSPPESSDSFIGLEKFKDYNSFKLVFDSETVNIYLVNPIYYGDY